MVSQHEQELFVTDLELSDHQILSCTLCPIQGFQVCVWMGGRHDSEDLYMPSEMLATAEAAGSRYQ